MWPLHVPEGLPEVSEKHFWFAENSKMLSEAWGGFLMHWFLRAASLYLRIPSDMIRMHFELRLEIHPQIPLSADVGICVESGSRLPLDPTVPTVHGSSFFLFILTNDYFPKVIL